MTVWEMVEHFWHSPPYAMLRNKAYKKSLQSPDARINWQSFYLNMKWINKNGTKETKKYKIEMQGKKKKKKNNNNRENKRHQWRRTQKQADIFFSIKRTAKWMLNIQSDFRFNQIIPLIIFIINFYFSFLFILF